MRVEVVKVSYDGPAVPVFGGELRLSLSTRQEIQFATEIPGTYTVRTLHCGGQSLSEWGGQVSVGQRDYEIKALEHSAEGVIWVIYSVARVPQTSNTANKGNMSNGPQLWKRGCGVWYGTYHILHFTEKDKGRILKIVVDSGGRNLCIELWQGVFDGVDSMSWAENRKHIIRSLQQPNPVLTWRVEPGDYTIYFVAHDGYGEITSYDIAYKVDVE